MSYRHVGRAAGREVFLRDEPSPDDPAQPQGYSIAAVVLKAGWTSDELGWLLNELYGALTDWTPFDPNAGARSFVFHGERAEEASNLCDAFSYAWTAGNEQQYDGVMCASNDAPDLDGFVEAILTGEIAIGDAYAGRLQTILFAAFESDPDLTAAVENGVKQHHFD